jgi:hypothetical protein
MTSEEVDPTKRLSEHQLVRTFGFSLILLLENTTLLVVIPAIEDIAVPLLNDLILLLA